jgi:hypothetical protein
MSWITPDLIKHLHDVGYFEGPSAACMAIMPFVEEWMVGVEIGVYGGDSSKLFVENCKFMHFIDPCFEYAENPDKGWFAIEEHFLKKMSFTNRFHFIKGMAADVADQIPEVDFVFIDGNHTYDYVKKDIDLYWPKIRRHGFLCGHDYTGGHPGVTQAVDEFSAAERLPMEQHEYCWLIRKP